MRSIRTEDGADIQSRSSACSQYPPYHVPLLLVRLFLIRMVYQRALQVLHPLFLGAAEIDANAPVLLLLQLRELGLDKVSIQWCELKLKATRESSLSLSSFKVATRRFQLGFH